MYYIFGQEKNESIADIVSLSVFIRYQSYVKRQEIKYSYWHNERKKEKIKMSIDNNIIIDDLFEDVTYTLPTSVDPEIAELYKSESWIVQMRAFYNDPRNAQIILSRLADILSTDKYSFISSKKDKLKQALNIYLAVHSRALLYNLFCTPTEIIDSILALYSRSYSPKLLSALLKESLLFIYNHEKTIKEKAMLFEEMNKIQKEHAQNNVNVEINYINDPDYGLTPDKPVFVNGFKSLHKYLDNVHTENNQPLQHERRGSTIVKGIDGPVDIYDFYTKNGEYYETIYICIYGMKTSRLYPKGLKNILIP